MAVHNKKDWGKPVDHPDNYGAYVTNSKGEVTYRNMGYSPGAMGGYTGNKTEEKADAGNKSVGDVKGAITNFFQNFRQNTLFAQVPPGAETYIPRRRGNVNEFTTTSSMERRVKLSLPGGLKRFYQSPNENSGLLNPLVASSGIVFPYTPQIIISNSANYASRSPIQTNYPYQIYQNSQVSNINLLVQFSAQNEEEARYVLACILFLRLITKSFRNNDVNAGSPPPVCRLTGHGKNLLPNVPVVVQDFSLTLPNNVDYISIATGGTGASNRGTFLQQLDRAQMLQVDRVPTMSDISVTMVPTYSRAQLADYNVKDIVSGGRLTNPDGFM